MSKKNMENDDEMYVTLTLDDDSEVECIVITIFEAGERDYIALLPMDDDDAEEGEVYLYRYAEDADGNPELTSIESDEEYEVVADRFDEWLDEQEYAEMADIHEILCVGEDKVYQLIDDIFAALAKQVAHLKSDVTTSMGLPVPLMGLFNLLQFGSIGEEEQTIAEIVQGMYYEGYDFIHFCSMSVPAMLVEVIVRLGYAIKRVKEGHAIKDSIPVSLNREKHPKLASMLFIAHTGATAANAGKVYFTQNPVAINYPQWVAFAKYSYSQLKWAVLEKPALRDAYVRGKINEELDVLLAEAEATFGRFAEEYTVIFQ